MKLTSRTVAGITNGDRVADYRDEELKGFLLRAQAVPGTTRTYFVAYVSPVTGRAVNYRLGTTAALTPAQARDAAETALARVALGQCPQTEKKRRKATSVADAVAAETARVRTLEHFLDHRYARWSGARHKRSAEILARLEANFGQWRARPLDEITKALAGAWAQERIDAGRSPSTVRRDLTDLKSVLSVAAEDGVIGTSPLAGWSAFKKPKDERVRWLSLAEEDRLRGALDDRTARLGAERERMNAWRVARRLAPLPPVEASNYLPAMVLLGLNTGLRRGEVFTLRWNAVDFAGRRLTVRAQYAKSGVARDVPLNAEAMAVLTRWRNAVDGDGWVFVSPKTGTPFTHIKTAWARLVEHAGVEDFRFHDLRHTFASRLVSAGESLYIVGELLGHVDPKTTRRYAHLAPDTKAAAVSRLDRVPLRLVG